MAGRRDPRAPTLWSVANDYSHAPAAEPSRRVELAAWTQRLPSRTRRQVRRHSIAGVVVGGLFLLLGLLGGIVRIIDRGFSPEVLGVLVLVVIGGLLCWNGIRRLGWVPRGAPDTPVRFSAPYAFELTDTTIEFPAYQANPAESWQLPGTSVEVTGQGRREALRLAHRGRRTRRYFAHALAESPASVAATVRARQSAGGSVTN